MRRLLTSLAVLAVALLATAAPASANNGVWNISHVCHTANSTTGYQFAVCIDQLLYLASPGYAMKTETEYVCQFGGQTIQCDGVAGYANQYVSTFWWGPYHYFSCSGNCSVDRNFDHYIQGVVVQSGTGCYQWQGHISNASGYIDGYKLDLSAFYGANNKICD